MSRLLRFTLVFALLLAGLPAMPAAATNPCVDGVQASGAVYRICIPEQWNGDLVIYAHGYVAPDQPIQIPEDQLSLPDGTYIPDLINSLGFAFATTSYSKNGLAVLQGVADVRDLAQLFKAQYPQTRYVYLVGASEGGLVTTLGIEQFPDVFSGGLATCGPVGNFRGQINYWGDFRVVFDYFFPGVLPPSPVAIPQTLMDNWETVYTPVVIQALQANPHATEQLLKVTKAPFDPNDPNTIAETVLGLLWYNVFATNDGVQTLGGQPFDNTQRIYLGSDNDLLLNLKVERFKADPAALANIANYQTSGILRAPLVTLHTTGDPIVPYWHELLYGVKILVNHSLVKYTGIPIERYGHCNFTANEVLASFAWLVRKVSRQTLNTPQLDLQIANPSVLYLPMLTSAQH